MLRFLSLAPKADHFSCRKELIYERSLHPPHRAQETEETQTPQATAEPAGFVFSTAAPAQPHPVPMLPNQSLAAA